MTKPKPKQIEIIQGVLEESLKAKAFKTTVDDCLVSLLFPESTKIPKDMTEIREELLQRGYIMFYSTVLEKDVPVLSINLTKI